MQVINKSDHIILKKQNRNMLNIPLCVIELLAGIVSWTHYKPANALAP